MKVETLSFQEILKHTPDVFEAVVVLSRRSLQINARRAAEQVIMEEDYTEDEYAEEEITENPDYVEEEKSTVMAMEDYLGKRLAWNYPEKEKVNADDSPVDGKAS